MFDKFQSAEQRTEKILGKLTFEVKVEIGKVDYFSYHVQKSGKRRDGNKAFKSSRSDKQFFFAVADI